MVMLAAVLAACGGGARERAELARMEAADRDPCAVALDRDFEGVGEAELQRYAHWLASTRGRTVGVTPRAVEVAIVRGEPKPGPVGVTAGEVACSAAGSDPHYRITLYRNALVGRPLATTYRTVAHEFEHVVQIHRDRLPCDAPGDAARERYEREAALAADRLVPACRRSAR
jgi:hypothetical protein